MTLKTLASATFIALGAVTLAAPLTAFAKVSADMKMIDPDSDGTVSLTEAQDAAAKKFAILDPDKDGTLDMKEAKGLMSKTTFKAADPDKDGTIDKTEYMTAVETTFKKADKDGDGTLDAKELSTPAGQKLLSLIQ
jgi:hypothetical protein